MIVFTVLPDLFWDAFLVVFGSTLGPFGIQMDTEMYKKSIWKFASKTVGPEKAGERRGMAEPGWRRGVGGR